MKNHWTQTSGPYAVWRGDLTAIAASPDALLDVLLAIEDKGRELEACVPPKRIDRRARFAATRQIEIAPDDAAACAARIAYFDAKGHVTESLESSVGALIERLGTAMAGVADDDPHYAVGTHYAPVQIEGWMFSYAPDGARTDDVASGIRFALHSDIWLPFVLGYEPVGFDRYFDNRQLANLHTPRLNAFLKFVAATLAARGGHLRLEQAEVSPVCRRWVSDTGIALEGPIPDLRDQ